MSEFINAMSRAVNGVSIVTTDGHLGRYGLTVSSMTSVSAEPPMLLVCVNRSSAAHDAIRDNGRFAVNVLGANQHRHAAAFAGNSEYGNAYAFDRESWDLAEPLPRLRSAAAYFRCELESAMSFGTHSIIVGRVTRSHPGEQSPLLYTGRDYGRPVRLS